MTLGRYVSGRDTFLNDGIIIYNLVQQGHILKHLNRIYLAGLFEKYFTKVIFGEVMEHSYHLFTTKQFLYNSIITEMYFTIDILKNNIKNIKTTRHTALLC